MKPIQKLRGEHCLNLYISHELKSRLNEIAKRYDRTTSDLVRAILKIGIPVMEGISQAEEIMMKDYIQLFRRMRQIRRIKE
jgi:predicted DNA-binding protein